MQLGMIGLGRMGANMVRRLIHGGQAVWCSINRRARSENWSWIRQVARHPWQ
jgi:6-phosphogluconate dehydrogenase (decarboxylating)